jgi:hypothetical protein
METESIISLANKKQDATACGKEFSLDESFSVVVAKCGSYTATEVQQMTNGLVRSWQKAAQAICDQNGNSCPNVTTTNYVPKTSTCVQGSDNKYVWSQFVTFTGKCTA